MNKKISIIVPVYNEEKNLPAFYAELSRVLAALEEKFSFEIIFVNDGSRDGSAQMIEELAGSDVRIRYIEFSRNFGKEIATTAGLNHAAGDAAIMLDADLQHPPAMIPKFVEVWEQGAEVVVGVRKKNNKDSWTKNIGAWFFYKIINRISDTAIVPNATDFRLLDRMVLDEFNRLTERNRMTRGLIAWLGFRRQLIRFDAPKRADGQASYSMLKLIRLAMSSFVSLSLFPLKLAGYIGIFIMLTSGLLGLFMFFDKYILDDPFGYHFSSLSSLAVLNIFLIGIVLTSLGLIALYIANIHGEVVNRPMYVIRRKKL